jgi:hypothetical protein
VTDPVERVERAVSLLIRLGVSVALPVWGLAMIILGAVYASGWWIACGVAVEAIGIVTFAASPLAAPLYTRNQPKASV